MEGKFEKVTRRPQRKATVIQWTGLDQWRCTWCVLFSLTESFYKNLFGRLQCVCVWMPECICVQMAGGGERNLAAGIYFLNVGVFPPSSNRIHDALQDQSVVRLQGGVGGTYSQFLNVYNIRHCLNISFLLGLHCCANTVAENLILLECCPDVC